MLGILNPFQVRRKGLADAGFHDGGDGGVPEERLLDDARAQLLRLHLPDVRAARIPILPPAFQRQEGRLHGRGTQSDYNCPDRQDS